MSDVYDYLTGYDGSVELLCEIDPNGSRHKDLKDEVPVSETTLNNRLEQGVTLSLLRKEATMGGRGTTNQYVLTPQGASIKRVLIESGTELAYQQYKVARRQYLEKEQEVYEWAATDFPQYTDEMHEQHLTLLQEGFDFRLPDQLQRDDETTEDSPNGESHDE